MTPRLTTEEALASLKQGNRRFVSGNSGAHHGIGPPDLPGSGVDQEPIAIVLGCSDSRVPAELVFDQGLGDLFVIRVAGNIVAPSQIASVEFAATRFGTRLVVVLGHTRCGAVLATIDELQRHKSRHQRGLRSIVDRIKPAVEDLVARNHGADSGALITDAVRANIHASVKKLREGLASIQALQQDGGLQIVGAEYSLDTGEVEFFD